MCGWPLSARANYVWHGGRLRSCVRPVYAVAHDDVRLTGFGTFNVADRAAREGRNPRTGEPIKIAASRQPKFKAGKGLKEAVNG